MLIGIITTAIIMINDNSNGNNDINNTKIMIIIGIMMKMMVTVMIAIIRMIMMKIRIIVIMTATTLVIIFMMILIMTIEVMTTVIMTNGIRGNSMENIYEKIRFTPHSRSPSCRSSPPISVSLSPFPIKPLPTSFALSLPSFYPSWIVVSIMIVRNLTVQLIQCCVFIFKKRNDINNNIDNNVNSYTNANNNSYIDNNNNNNIDGDNNGSKRVRTGLQQICDMVLTTFAPSYIKEID